MNPPFHEPGSAVPPSPALRYRPNVAGILLREDGRVLVCQRLDRADCWQFPQGGVKAKDRETPVEALWREMGEELSLRPRDYTVLRQAGPYRYLFEPGRKKRDVSAETGQKIDFDGQEQTWFLLRFTGREKRIDVRTAHPEFSQTRWVAPADFDMAWVPPFKREVYQKVFFAFFGIEKVAQSV